MATVRKDYAPSARHPIVAAVDAMVVASPLSDAPAQDAKLEIDIGKNGVGAAPADFDFWITGEGTRGQWAVVRELRRTPEN